MVSRGDRRGGLGDKMRVRVGDDQSPVLPGEPSPTGGVYREGQYAPTIEELSSQTLARAKEAGVVSTLPIYDGEGNVDKKKLEEWDPRLHGVHFDSDVPKYSSAIIYDALNGRSRLIEELKLVRVSAGSRDEQLAHTIYGEVIIRAAYNTKNGFTGKLIIYPSFYKYVSVPLVGKLPGRDEGLSVGAYAVFHALGHLKFAKTASSGSMSKIAKMLSMSEWSKTSGDHAHYFDYANPEGWHREKTEPLTQVGGYSPEDEFAEAFALYYTNREYLERASPKKFDIVKEIVGDYL